MRVLTISLTLVLFATSNLAAAVFQYAVPVETRKGERMAFLWVPPEAPQVRGIVIGGMTLMERELAKDPRIREACASAQLAIVFLKCGLGATDIQAVLDSFAEASGYQELSIAPLLFVGHSAGGPQARRLAREMGGRCFGLVQYRGADPGDVDHDGEAGIAAGIPALMVIGQFDEFGRIGRDENGIENWEKDRDKLALFRKLNERNFGSILVEPGGGHFAWSDRNARYLALFIPRAARARIPDTWPTDATAPVELKSIEPASGWLTDLAIGVSDRHTAAPYVKYSGDRSRAAWHLDETLALATEAYHADLTKADQFIHWMDPHRVNGGARNFFTRVQWTGDGQAFEVHPEYSDTYPTQAGGRRQRWGRAGESVGHSSSPLFVKHVSGPIVHTGPETYAFRIRFDALAPATERARVTFMAFSEGDNSYRYTERVGMIASDLLSGSEGQPQTISFPAIETLAVASSPVPLRATSSAGLPVEFYVASGPARVVDGQLVISAVPRRAKFPIKIKVVAWQFGRRLEPLVQTAEPVDRTISLTER